MRSFYSVVDSVAADADSLKREALDFHRVTRELFNQAAIIPFRFPTTLESVAQIDAYVQKHAPAFHATLDEYRDTVQLELRIQLLGTENAPASSGIGYLKSRAQSARRIEEAIAACRFAINEEVIHWHQREASHGVRCFALINREAVRNVQQQIEGIRFDGGITAALSGPWPPTEFFPAFNE